MLLYGDYGGFGVGADSTWQLLATLNYNLTDRKTLSLGYKTLAVDYSNAGHVFDTTLSGPVVALTFRF
ncbi:MAG: hypothetical protein BroJett030_09760 [Alphaproteobacteria bacterium]|nr:MAG: hypothetical protein BroJett030_09760 [Alphaproteobacteria bacterium]